MCSSDLRWSHSAVWFAGSLVVAAGTVYACGWNGQVYALDAASGRLRWFYQAGVYVGSAAVAYGAIYLATAGGTVYALRAGS